MRLCRMSKDDLFLAEQHVLSVTPTNLMEPAVNTESANSRTRTHASGFKIGGWRHL